MATNIMIHTLVPFEMFVEPALRDSRTEIDISHYPKNFDHSDKVACNTVCFLRDFDGVDTCLKSFDTNIVGVGESYC